MIKPKPALAALLLAVLGLSPLAHATTDPIVVGKIRVTVVTPNLARIEYQPDGKWIDDRSLFAINRTARFDATVKHEDRLTTIETPALRMRVTDDGKAPGPNNLTVQFRVASNNASGFSWVAWNPGMPNQNNLGGTIATVDQVSGPVDLGQGLLSRDGWYLLDDSKSPLLTTDWVKDRPLTGTDWYFFAYGQDYPAALRSLTTISGPVPLPRRYTMGAWYSRYWNYTADEFKNIVREYTEHNFPLDVIVMDMDWHITKLTPNARGQIWTGFTWDKALIPDPAGLLKWFHSQGLAVTLNDHPADGVQPHEEMYESFMKRMNADPATKTTIPFDAGDKHYLDTFWEETHVPRQNEGVDFWWLDWQQYPFTRSVKTLTNLAWLNVYYYGKSEHDSLRGTSFSRWAGWGDHRHPIHFSGDAHTNWEMLAFEVPLTSTAGNVGCFFWSHDIGGHMAGRNEESYTRWCQFGAMSAALRSHSTRDAKLDRRPWTYPDWAEDSMRKSFHLRSELFPYIYSAAAQATRDSVPLTRPMYFEYPHQEAAYHHPQQYLLGDALLVAPIVTPGTGPGRVAQQVVWFPPGTWYNYFTGEQITTTTGEERVVAAPIDQFPLYVKAGVPVPMQPYTPRMATTNPDEIILRCYPGTREETAQLYEDDGVTTDYRNSKSAVTHLHSSQRGETTTIEISPITGTFTGQQAERAYQLIFPCLQKPRSITVDGASVALGTSATYDEAAHTVTVKIAKQSIFQKHTVELTATRRDPKFAAQEAAAAIAQAAGPGTAGKLMANGVALLLTTDSPTGYAGQLHLTFHANPGVLDNDQFQVSTGPRPTIQAVTPGGFEIPMTAADSAQIEFTRTAKVQAKLAGEIITLEKTWPVEGVLADKRNIARSAKVTTSSSESGYSPQGAVDGVASGYPRARSAEWSSNHEKAGAWIRLTWDAPQSISTIALFDRPNTTDQVTKSTIRFSDGSTLEAGELPNDGNTPALLRFEPRTVTWVEIKVDEVKPETQNAGFGEVAVFTK